jgi:hypothetical protein
MDQLLDQAEPVIGSDGGDARFLLTEELSSRIKGSGADVRPANVHPDGDGLAHPLTAPAVNPLTI